MLLQWHTCSNINAVERPIIDVGAGTCDAGEEPC